MARGALRIDMPLLAGDRQATCVLDPLHSSRMMWIDFRLQLSPKQANKKKRYLVLVRKLVPLHSY